MEFNKGCLPFLLLLCILFGAVLLAFADGPGLSNVFPDDDTLALGQTVLRVDFDAGSDGTLVLTARLLGSSAEPRLVKEQAVSAGHGVVEWDGRIDGADVELGSYELFLALRDSSGAVSPASAAIVEVVGAPPTPPPTPPPPTN
ncbi:MAG: hypothetical protein FWD25_12690, partial [Clostridia bacterium]|nr:hypothetical protein [Clostridia bacterium]